MTSRLPVVIVLPALARAASALASELSRFAGEHPECSLDALENAVLGALRTAAPALLAATLAGSHRRLQDTSVAPPPRCPQCHQPAAVHDWRPRTLQTRAGPLQFARPWAQCGPCGHGFSPTDTALGLAGPQRLSAGLRQLLVALGGETSFRAAARLLTQTTGLVVSAETVRSVTEAAGAVALAQQAQQAAHVAQTATAPAPHAPAPDQLVAEADGVMVRFQDGWHEVKVGVVGGWDTVAAQQGPAPHLQAPSYVALRGQPAVFGAQWGAEAARRGAVDVVGWYGRGNRLARLRHAVVIGDGAAWIWEQAAAQFGDRTEIVDFYHACEHLTTVAGLLAGVGSAAATAWATARREELRSQGVAAILPHLATPTGLDAGAAAKLRTERGYFSGNAARMQYPAFRAAGLPIGSGAVESSARHVIQQRLKRAGARWSDAGGQVMVALRAQHATQLAQAA
ncbi:MAG TPA: ISKra4 family transposase [Dehalococcoidia bacterium]|nr:ISKra4 family transposase [Dehalococcoidia bacterium]